MSSTDGPSATLSSPPLTPTPEPCPLTEMASTATTSSGFDIVSHCRSLLSSDPSLTPPIAAIESLIALLTSTPATTVSETLSLLQEASASLLSQARNPIALSAGTDLFQRYVIATMQRPATLSPATTDFSLLRHHLISNSRLFLRHAKEARSKIATHALPFLSSTSSDLTILTYGPSRTVSTLLLHAAQHSRPFKTIYVAPATPSPALDSQISSLRSAGVPTASISCHAIAYTLASLPPSTPLLVITGASAVLENGGVVSGMGTYQLGLLAKALRKPFYVACESYKVVRMYPLGQTDLGIRQDVLEFHTAEQEEKAKAEEQEGGDVEEAEGDGKVDMTPPELITALITENGVMTPAAVSEELIKLWF